MGDYTVRGKEMQGNDPIEDGKKANASLPFQKRKHSLSETNNDVPLAKRKLDDSKTKDKSASPVLNRKFDGYFSSEEDMFEDSSEKNIFDQSETENAFGRSLNDPAVNGCIPSKHSKISLACSALWAVPNTSAEEKDVLRGASTQHSLVTSSFATFSEKISLETRVGDLERENKNLKQMMYSIVLENKWIKIKVTDLEEKMWLDSAKKLDEANCFIKEFNSKAVNKTCDCIIKSLKETTISPESDMVPLVEGHNLKIDKLALNNILKIGKLSRKNLRRMVNKILESIYTRVYMSEHSLSGKAPPAPGITKDLITKGRTLKPGLPVEDVSAITQFAIQVWEKTHGEVIKPKEVRGAIRLKLTTETKAHLSATKVSNQRQL